MADKEVMAFAQGLTARLAEQLSAKLVDSEIGQTMALGLAAKRLEAIAKLAMSDPEAALREMGEPTNFPCLANMLLASIRRDIQSVKTNAA